MTGDAACRPERSGTPRPSGLRCGRCIRSGGGRLFGVVLGLRFVETATNVSADSHFRYLSGLLLAIGLAYWSMIPGDRDEDPARSSADPYRVRRRPRPVVRSCYGGNSISRDAVRAGHGADRHTDVVPLAMAHRAHGSGAIIITPLLTRPERIERVTPPPTHSVQREDLASPASLFKVGLPSLFKRRRVSAERDVGAGRVHDCWGGRETTWFFWGQEEAADAPRHPAAWAQEKKKFLKPGRRRPVVGQGPKLET